MIHSVTITMNYTGLGGNPDGSVVKKVNADLSDVKHVIDNVSYGREQKVITGNIIITDEYDDFGIYLNDTSGYYIDFTDFSYTMIRNGHELETGKIKLTNNNFEYKELTFNLYDEIYDIYQEIYSNWETDLNIFTYTGGGGGIVQYKDFRTLNTKITSDTQGFSSQEDYEDYINSLISSDDNWIPVKVTCTGTAPAYSVSIEWNQFRDSGMYIGSERFPPSGINWTYDTDISGWPVYMKKTTQYNIEYGTYISGFAPSVTTIYTNQESDIDYTTAAYSTNELVSIFCAKQFGGLLYSISGLDDFVGESLPVGHPARVSIYQNRPYKYIQFINASDFIPAADGGQKSTRSVIQYLNFKTLSDWLESIGFFWYIDDAAGTPVMRFIHYSLKSLGGSNPDLTNYYNRNHLAKTRNYKIIDSEFDIITNSTEGDYIFSAPEYRFFDGNKKKEYIQNRIYTNIDQIIDVKDEAIEVSSGKNWVALLTTWETSKYYVRYIKSDLFTNERNTNNYEASFYWLARNNMQMPGRISSGGDEFSQEFTLKRKEITLNGIPIDNPQDDFTIYDYIDYYGEEAEIVKIEMPTLSRECSITIKIY